MSTFRQKVQATTNWVKPDPEDLVEAQPKPRRSSARRAGAPVTAHRLFPAFAALWFAALFGLGSLAIPSSLLGAVVLKTGLPAVVPAAAPPLGFTAHLLVAFALTVSGAALGLALALRLRPRSAAVIRAAAPVAPAAEPEAAESYKVRARDAHPDAPPRRPLVLTEALVDSAIDEAAEPELEPAAPLLRRKRMPLASEAETEAAPTTPWIPEFTPGGTGAIRPLDLSVLDLDDPVEQPYFAKPEPVAVEAVEVPSEPAPEPEPEPEPVAERPAEPAAPVMIAATPQLPTGFAAALADVADGKRSPVAGAPLENLGLVQLIERLALAIAEQKAANEAVIAADNAAAAEAAPETGDMVEVVPAEPEFEPGPFSRPQPVEPASEMPAFGSAREAILRRLGAIASGERLEGSDAQPAARPFERPAPAPATAEAVVPIRSAEPAAPALPLTSTPPMAPVEADEALRSALATLQRMTARA